MTSSSDFNCRSCKRLLYDRRQETCGYCGYPISAEQRFSPQMLADLDSGRLVEKRPQCSSHVDSDSPVSEGTPGAEELLDLVLSEVSGDEKQYQEEGRARDSSLIRWSKFLAIIVVLAGLLGGAFAVEHMLEISDGRSEAWYLNPEARTLARRIEVRFYIGASIGACLGVVYVARCLAKDLDP